MDGDPLLAESSGARFSVCCPVREVTPALALCHGRHQFVLWPLAGLDVVEDLA